LVYFRVLFYAQGQQATGVSTLKTLISILKDINTLFQ